MGEQCSVFLERGVCRCRTVYLVDCVFRDAPLASTTAHSVPLLRGRARVEPCHSRDPYEGRPRILLSPDWKRGLHCCAWTRHMFDGGHLSSRTIKVRTKTATARCYLLISGLHGITHFCLLFGPRLSPVNSKGRGVGRGGAVRGGKNDEGEPKVSLDTCRTQGLGV